MLQSGINLWQMGITIISEPQAMVYALVSLLLQRKFVLKLVRTLL
jgi:hypothetical protein